MVTPTSTTTPIVTEIKTLAEKLIGQVASFAGYYVVVAHTDWSRLETATGAAVAAFVGYVLNRLRTIKV